MSAPVGTIWGSEIKGRVFDSGWYQSLKTGLYINTETLSNTKVRVHYQIWLWVRGGLSYSTNNVYFNFNSNVAETLVKNIDINTTGEPEEVLLHSGYVDCDMKTLSDVYNISAAFELRKCNGFYSDLEGKKVPITSAITITFEEYKGTVRIKDSSGDFNEYAPYIFNGSTWVRHAAYVHDGSSFKIVC